MTVAVRFLPEIELDMMVEAASARERSGKGRKYVTPIKSADISLPFTL